MDFKIKKDEQLLIITPNSKKREILKKFSNQIIDIKFMDKEEYKRHFFFSYDNKTLDYIMSKYSYSLDFAKIIVNQLYVINIDEYYQDTKLINLQNIKKDLLNNNLLSKDPHFLNFLKNRRVIVYSYDTLEKYEEEIFKNAEIIKSGFKEVSKKVIKCQTLEEEILYVIYEINKLINAGVSLNNIFLTNIKDEDRYLIYKLFSYHKIPINLDLKQSLYGTSIVKEYLKTKKLPGFINDVSKKLIEVLNSLVELEDSPNYQEFLIDSLKHTTIPYKKYKNAIQVLDDPSKVSDEEYLFILGFNQDVLPKIYKDLEYLSDDLKEKVGLDSTSCKNKKEKDKVISIISNTKNLYLSYREKSSFQEYLKSSLIDDLNLEVIEYNKTISNSHLYNKLVLGKLLDNYYKYNESNNDLKSLYQYYDIPYNTYNNNFKGLDSSKLCNFIDNYLRVSYTSLNSYYLCGFQYYINYILKINPYDDNFSTVIGNIFHYIFSVMDSEYFNFEREWNNYIEKLNLSIKERFFLEHLKNNLKDDIEVIRKQDLLTTYQDKLYEQEINLKLDKKIDVVFTGKIDKMMMKKIDNDTCISVVDYKTGNISTNINNLKYGLNMQLPIYLYLAKNSFLVPNMKFSGMYLQKVLFPKYSFDPKKNIKTMIQNDLRLQGYSTDNIERLSLFDKSYEKSELIKGMKINKDGSFSMHSNVLSDTDVDNILSYTETKVNEAVDNILAGDFSINPKVIDNKNLSCEYCKFQDICFKKNENLIYYEKIENLDFLGGE